MSNRKAKKSRHKLIDKNPWNIKVSALTLNE